MVRVSRAATRPEDRVNREAGVLSLAVHMATGLGRMGRLGMTVRAAAPQSDFTKELMTVFVRGRFGRIDLCGQLSKPYQPIIQCGDERCAGRQAIAIGGARGMAMPARTFARTVAASAANAATPLQGGCARAAGEEPSNPGASTSRHASHFAPTLGEVRGSPEMQRLGALIPTASVAAAKSASDT